MEGWEEGSTRWDVAIGIVGCDCDWILDVDIAGFFRKIVGNVIFHSDD